MRAVFAVLALLGTAAAVHADSASTSMSVSVTVVRSCAVSAQTDVVTLACSSGVTRVSLGSTAVRPLVPGSNALRVSSSDASTGVVTINF